MLPPYVYEEARATAAAHVEVAVVTVQAPEGLFGDCLVDGRVTRVMRGALRVGEVVRFPVACAREWASHTLPVGGTLWLRTEKLMLATALEVYLNRDGAGFAPARDQVFITAPVDAPAPVRRENPAAAAWKRLFGKR